MTRKTNSKPRLAKPVAELKAKAGKAKDATVTKVTNTRDRYSSAPSSQVPWDPNWKRAPPGASPTPLRSRPNVVEDTTTVSGPPAIPRCSRPADDTPLPPFYAPLPPPTRAASGYPPSHRETSHDTVDRIDWANLSPEDKEVFFGWLDEFFSRYLGIELGPRARRPAPRSVPAVPPVQRPPPVVNMTTRPQA